MVDLILLNGPPASGKSTMAQRYIEANPFALNLDIDVLRQMIGGWTEDPEAAGTLARSFAVALASQHLSSGHDVIVPQFLGRPDFIDELADVASAAGARFVEIALRLGRAEAISAFAERSAAPETQSHRDATTLVARSTAPDPIGSMFDDFTAVVAGRPQTREVEVVSGDRETTFRRLCEALS